MPWRCVSVSSGFCNGEPDWEKKPEIMHPGADPIGFPQNGTYKLDPKECGKFLTLGESLKRRVS